MDLITKDTILKRFNEAIYDLALATIALRKDDNSFVKHTRDAGEAISQTAEYALKFHLNNNMSNVEKVHYNPFKQNIASLIDKYVDSRGEKSDYYYNTIDDVLTPTVNFIYLRNNKKYVTNAAKHEGEDPDFEIQIQFLEQVRLFIKQYIDNSGTLKTIQDFEKVDLSNWDLLYTACDRFSKEERTFILIIGPEHQFEKHYLKNLGIPSWDLIIDFDYNSEANGFFNIAFKQSLVSPHRIKSSDLIDANVFSKYSQSHYHYFANNFKGSGESETKDFADWNRKFAKNTDTFLKAFSNVFRSQKTIVLSLFNSRRHVNFLCEKIEQYFGDNISFVFANDFTEELDRVSEDFHGVKVNISVNQIAVGLSDFSSNFGVSDPYKDQYTIPFLESSETKDVTGVLTPELFAKLEEDFEVVHKGLPTRDTFNEDRRSFLCGESRISWFGLKNRFDVERANFNRKYIKPIEKLIENGRGKIFLLHDAGYGGTTVARRIAWEIHNEYPTLILKKFRDNKVREKIIDLHQRTRKTIFIIMEVPQAITLDEVDSLYKSIPAARPVVFLIVKRGRPGSNDLSVTDWGNNVSELTHAYSPFLKELESPLLIADKQKAFEEVLFSIDPYKKTPFYIGLLTFEERFFAIKDFVKKFVVDVQNKEEQRRVLAYLAITNDYLGQGLPAAFFKNVFRIDSKISSIFNLEEFFSIDSSIIDSLLVSYQEGNQKFWKIRHAFLAIELKRQILSGLSENPEIWKQGLADMCIKLIEDSVTDASTTDYVQETLQKLFIGNRKDRAGEDFTSIIKDMPSIDEKEQVFLTLKNSYPDNPHYCSHLARFYAYNNKNRDKALKYADEAIRLSEMEGNADPLLYHIKGMCLRSIAYDIMERHRKIISQGKEIDRNESDDVLFRLVPEAANEFELSRLKSKEQNKIDEHGYVAHIQLLIRAIDYGAIISNKSTINFLAENKEPYSDWLDLAESLLEDVKRINQNDESGKIEDCENDIEELYGNFELILQNLRNQLDKGKNPSRTRRQIVRTYFRRNSDFTKDIKIVNNILSLMEQNIDNEPDNERNFFLWFKAARYSRYSIEDAINKLSRWKANSSSIDAIYYFYILKVIRGLQGYSDAIIDAYNLIKECRSKGKSNTAIFEWFGKGADLNKLVNASSLDPANKDEKLELVKGYFTDYQHDGYGKIIIGGKLEIFFSPTQAKLTSDDLNKEVEFYLGFSYDGLRADSYSVRISGHEPRNKEVIQFNEAANALDRKEIFDALIQNEQLKIERVNETIKSNLDFEKNKKRLIGKVIDLQRPPVYTMGKVETDLGKKYFFHRDNEKKHIFNSLKINTLVSFRLKNTNKGMLAYDIELLVN